MSDAYSQQAIDDLCARLPIVARLYERRRVEGVPNPMDYEIVGVRKRSLRFAWALSRIAGGDGLGTAREATPDEIASWLSKWLMPHVVIAQLMDINNGTQVVLEGITLVESRDSVAGFVALLNAFAMPSSLRWTPDRVIRAWLCTVTRSDLRHWLHGATGGAEILPFAPRRRIKG